MPKKTSRAKYEKKLDQADKRLYNEQATVRYLQGRLEAAERDKAKAEAELAKLRQFSPTEQERIRNMEKARELGRGTGLTGAFGGKPVPPADLIKLSQFIADGSAEATF